MEPERHHRHAEPGSGPLVQRPYSHRRAQSASGQPDPAGQHSGRDRLHPYAVSGFLVQQSILGLHHVTATVNEAQPDLDFYRSTLGLRLVKKTVNFDNHNVYHFYYGDERGAPGTIWTTFPYGGWGVAPGRHGAGQITTTSFSVPGGSLSRWMLRLQDKGLLVQEEGASAGNAIIATDPSGLRVRLIETTDDPRTPWTGN